MNKFLFPGYTNKKEILLVTGGLNSAFVGEACKALAEGCRAEGLSVSIASPGFAMGSSSADQIGNYNDWNYDADITIVDFGEYLGKNYFRYGRLSPIPFTRTIFFTPASERTICHTVPTETEKTREREVLEYVEQHLSTPIHLTKPSMLVEQGMNALLHESNAEIVDKIGINEVVSEQAIERRKQIMSNILMGQIPKLKRRLW
jgi:hypothetical protein